LLSLSLDTSPMFPGACVVPILRYTMRKNPMLETVRVELGQHTRDLWRVKRTEDRELLEQKASIAQTTLTYWPPALRSLEVGCSDPGILATIPPSFEGLGRRSLSLYLRDCPLHPYELAVHARSLAQRACHRRPMTVSIYSEGNWDSPRPVPVITCERG
jgi:hypothetical protein